GVDRSLCDSRPCYLTLLYVPRANRVLANVARLHRVPRDVVSLHSVVAGQRTCRARQGYAERNQRDDHRRRRPEPADASHWSPPALFEISGRLRRTPTVLSAGLTAVAALLSGAR